MSALYRKEIRTYFTTPLGYAFMAVFLAVSGCVFALTTYQAQTSDVSSYFQLMIFGYIVVVPLLTMRSFAEEKRSKTDQLLMSSPISERSMVLAKFFAALTMFAITVLLSCIYYLPLFGYGEPNVGRAFGCLIGMFLIGACFIAVGLFVSSLTDSSVTACVGTMGILAFLAGISVFNSLIDSYFVRTVLSWISVYSRYSNFAYGMFDIASAVYYVSITAVFVFLSIRVLERRRYA
ncbi:MAG: ABC transporter permease [Clostridia bacterium]|nr:ABC transporter permease [Clostridia bacterium]